MSASDRLDADEFIAAAAAETLPDGFHHREHVHLAWALLRRDGLGIGGDATCRMVRGFAEGAGKPEVYHETITWAFLLLVHARLGDAAADEAWPAFAAANPDLFAWPSPALARWWSPELLASDAARTRLVLPDAVHA